MVSPRRSSRSRAATKARSTLRSRSPAKASRRCDACYEGSGMTDERPVIPPEFGQARERFLALVSELRPELHRYCARLVGSVVVGEDIVQESLAKAFYAISMATEVPPLRPWLFRVAHNTAI